MRTICLTALLLSLALPLAARKKAEAPKSALDQYVGAAAVRSAEQPQPTPGAIWTPASRLSDSARDLRACQIDDIVTIVVAENASAVAKGTTKTARSSSANASITSLAGPKKATGSLANLAATSGNTQLSGDGTTSRQTTLSTTLSARVTQVLPNGNLVLEGSKTVQVNSEHQTVTVRGVIRPADLTPANTVASNSLAQLEVRVSGKGVVNDAVRRPMFLYRLLLGILPF